MEERNLYDKSKFVAAVWQFFLVLLIRKLFICFVEDIYFFHPHVSILSQYVTVLCLFFFESFFFFKSN